MRAIPDHSSRIYITAHPCTLLQILFTIALLTAVHCLNLYELWTNLRASALFSIIAAISLADLKCSRNVIKHVAIPQAFIFPLIKPEPSSSPHPLPPSSPCYYGGPWVSLDQQQDENLHTSLTTPVVPQVLIKAKGAVKASHDSDLEVCTSGPKTGIM